MSFALHLGAGELELSAKINAHLSTVSDETFGGPDTDPRASFAARTTAGRESSRSALRLHAGHSRLLGAHPKADAISETAG